MAATAGKTGRACWLGHCPDISENHNTMNDPFERPNARRLAIFGHPTHELAILGLVQRHRPHVLVLTDGGSETRVAESKRGFELLVLADRVTYLGYSESSF